MRTSTAFIDWNMRTDVALFDLIEPRHPYTSGSGIGLRLSEGLSDLHERRSGANGSSPATPNTSVKSTLGGFGAYIAGKARNSLPASRSTSSTAGGVGNDEAESAWQSPFSAGR